MLFVGWQDQEWYLGDLSNSFCVALYQDEVAWFAEIEKKNHFWPITCYMIYLAKKLAVKCFPNRFLVIILAAES